MPIVPGIMPITNYSQIKTITGMCGATIPAELSRELDERAEDSEAVAELGTAYAALQCSDLLARGAPGIHFYTLNKSPATRAILAALRAAQPWTRAQGAGLGRQAPSARGRSRRASGPRPAAPGGAGSRAPRTGPS